MPKHADNDPVLFGYGSSRNISFNNEYSRDESGYTWGGWRAMSQEEHDAVINEYVWELVEVFVVDSED